MICERLYWTVCLARHLRGQAGYPFQPLDRIHADRDRRVRAMVVYAYQYVPYYRETMDRLGVSPADLTGAGDLARLPLLEPEQVQRDPEYFVSRAQPLKSYLRLRSGGSTGSPRTVYHDARAVLQNAAHGERERSIVAGLLGRRLGYRETVIAAPESSVRKVQEYIRRHTLFPARARMQRQYVSLLETPERAVRLINDFRPDVIHSYGSYLEILFGHMSATGESLRSPRAITYSSDALSASVRRGIERRYGIPVFSTYQAVEAFKIGFECEQHAGFHLNVDLYPLRIVSADGERLPVGESGEVVVSNLVNRATVLLNYRLGDLAALVPGQCRCGRQLPLLSFIQGRSNDIIWLPSGRVLHPQAAHAAIKVEEKVLRYQVVQEAPSHFHVAVVASVDADRCGIRQRLAARFAELLGEGCTTEISFVDSIERTPGCKFRAVLSLGPGNQGMRPAPTIGTTEHRAWAEQGSREREQRRAEES